MPVPRSTIRRTMEDYGSQGMSRCITQRHGADYNLLATSTAVSSWVSLPAINASRESSTENFGIMPLFSSIRPCHVR